MGEREPPIPISNAAHAAPAPPPAQVKIQPPELKGFMDKKLRGAMGWWHHHADIPSPAPLARAS